MAKDALTKWGYVGGAINFIVCTYLMCVETINLTADRKLSTEFIGKLVGKDSSASSEEETTDVQEAPEGEPSTGSDEAGRERFLVAQWSFFFFLILFFFLNFGFKVPLYTSQPPKRVILL